MKCITRMSAPLRHVKDYSKCLRAPLLRTAGASNEAFARAKIDALLKDERWSLTDGKSVPRKTEQRGQRQR
jgi:hypothetical protein